jgi:hypothetical protein
MLGRAGRLTEAAHTIEAMPIQPDLSMCRTLRPFCKLHNNPVVGKNIARKILELDPLDMLPQDLHNREGVEVSKLKIDKYELSIK